MCWDRSVIMHIKPVEILSLAMGVERVRVHMIANGSKEVPKSRTYIFCNR